MKYLITLIVLAFSINANAQSFTDLLNRKKDEIIQKAQNKAESKVDNAIDKSIEGIASKKSKNKRNSENNNETGASNSNTSLETKSYNESANVSGNEIVITSNVKCQDGSDLLEELIRGKNGVMNVSIDLDKGKIYVSIANNSDKDLKENILKIITDNGFTANGKQPKTKTNVCK